MGSSTVRTLAFVALGLLVATSSCATFVSMEPYNETSLSFDK